MIAVNKCVNIRYNGGIDDFEGCGEGPCCIVCKVTHQYNTNSADQRHIKYAQSNNKNDLDSSNYISKRKENTREEVGADWWHRCKERLQSLQFS